MYGETELKENIKLIEKFTKELLKDKEKCREFIYKLGFHTKKGKLKKQFRNE